MLLNSLFIDFCSELALCFCCRRTCIVYDFQFERRGPRDKGESVSGEIKKAPGWHVSRMHRDEK